MPPRSDLQFGCRGFSVVPYYFEHFWARTIRLFEEQQQPSRQAPIILPIGASISACLHWLPCLCQHSNAAVEFETFSGLGTLPVGETFQMNPSRQHSQYSMLTDAPMHQRGTLIELLVMISIIGVLICDKQ
jgi:hypothetical protein